MRAISLFSGAGGMDAGFEAAGVDILWANECNTDAVNTYRANHLAAQIEHADIRDAKRLLTRYADEPIDLVFGGPPCQGFSVAGKMDPNDERNTMVWEFFDVVEMLSPSLFVMENVKALGMLARWREMREKIFKRSGDLGYHCFSRILNAADFGVPQNRERVLFIGVKLPGANGAEALFDACIQSRRKPPPSLRECLLRAGTAGTPENPITCTAKISLALNPVIRRSPYAGMLFNGAGRPLNLDGLANTLPASMGGNKTPIVDGRLLHDPSAENWIAVHHQKLLRGEADAASQTVPDYFRRLTIREAAAVQTFPPGYVFCGEKSSVHRQIGNAVPCSLAKAIAEAVIETAQNMERLRTAG